MSEINNCFCGRKAEVNQEGFHGESRYVLCTREQCWTGPIRKSQKQAIEAWNKRTEKKEEDSGYVPATRTYIR